MSAERRILLSQAHVTELEERYVVEALHSGWVAPLGPWVDRFERQIAERVGVAGALALSSGTAALHLALLEVGARAGRVVVVPTLTFAATANAVAYTGAELVFVDALRADGNLDPQLTIEAVDALRAEGRDVAAVVPVDLLGRCVDYSLLEPALAERGIALVEDAAEALGAGNAGGMAGSFGRAAALSFNGNKIMTTSGGGMLVSDDLDLLDRARYLSTQARQPVAWYEHTEIGFNYRMSNILAAIGCAQEERLDAMIARRREIRARYAAAFEDLPGVRLLGGEETGAGDNAWLTCIEVGALPRQTTDGPRVDPLIAVLGERGIEARHLWKPMHLQPVFAENRSFLTGTSEALFSNCVNLPSGIALSDDGIDYVIEAVVQHVRTAEVVSA